MNNSSTLLETALDEGWSNLAWYVIYTVQGLVISLGNILIVLTIGRFEALRNNKEYIIIFGLSLADTINMLGYLFAGTFRIGLLVDGIYHTKFTAAYCMSRLHSVCWSIGATLSTMMLATVSIDRLLCVLSPLSYLGWTASYARLLVGSVYCVNVVTSSYMLLSSHGDQRLFAATCVPESITAVNTHPAFHWYYTRTPQKYAVLSVVVYFAVAVLYKRINAVVCTEHPNQQHELKRQRKVTITLSFSALCTFCLYVVPFSIAAEVYEAGYYNLALALWCTSNLNPLSNVFLYPLRHKEMRKGIKALVSCKRLPHDLKLWTVQPHVARGNEVPMSSVNRQMTTRPAANVHANRPPTNVLVVA